MAARFVQARVAPDGSARDAPEILMAGQPAERWRSVLAPPVDLLAHREATDSNLVWEAQEGLSGLLRAAVR
jgi:hypothetical protein